MNNLQVREDQIKQGLVAQQKMVKSLFGDKAKADKFLATAAKVATDYKLANCNVNSIIDACVTVAQLNLDLSPALSHAYIVPFKQSVQLIVSARGYTALLARNGWKLKSYIVNEADDFEYVIDGFEETIRFVKNIDDMDEKFRYAVALAQSPDGTLYIEVMNAKQIDKHRLVSSNQKGSKPTGVWADWFNEMAKKTVIKKLVKQLPLGEEIMTAVAKDDKPIEAEIIADEKETVDINSMITSPATPEHDELTGEVYQDKDIERPVTQKPDMSLLDGVNADCTDKEMEEAV
ncbi:recombinase RecT [Sulfurimonas sp.]|uniref:recombinase RecT n=1 Tax=Sulfurimonas sp. TaxID=2022749 RepID=UPI00356393C5